MGERSRYRDFDQALAQLEPIAFTINKKRYTLAQEPPAAVLLKVLEQGIPDNEAPEVLRRMIGEELYDELLADGVTLRQLMALSMWLAEESLGGVEEVVGDGEASTNNGHPPSASKRSSKSGQR